jgi:hypothetical protein
MFRYIIPQAPTRFNPAVKHHGATANHKSAIANRNGIGLLTPGKFWIELDRLVEVPAGAVELAFGCMHKCTASMESRSVRGIVLTRGDCPRARGNDEISTAQCIDTSLAVVGGSR